jgi:hypothetical protein
LPPDDRSRRRQVAEKIVDTGQFPDLPDGYVLLALAIEVSGEPDVLAVPQRPATGHGHQYLGMVLGRF